MDLQIEYIEYSPLTRSLDIFTIGCDGSCKGCCNPQIKDWNLKGLNINQTITKIKDLYNQFEILIDKFIIVGGDPVDGEIKTKGQVSELINQIKYFSNKPVYVFTRHDLSEIPDSILYSANYIKTGAYIPELTTDNNIQYGIKLATSNQKIYKLR